MGLTNSTNRHLLFPTVQNIFALLSLFHFFLNNPLKAICHMIPRGNIVNRYPKLTQLYG